VVGYKLQKSQVNLLKLMISQGLYKGQRNDYDTDYGNGCDLDHVQDIGTSNGHADDECFRSISSFPWKVSYQGWVGVILAEYKEWLGRAVQLLARTLFHRRGAMDLTI
jgi:hypothetical protein